MGDLPTIHKDTLTLILTRPYLMYSHLVWSCLVQIVNQLKVNYSQLIHAHVHHFRPAGGTGWDLSDFPFAPLPQAAMQELKLAVVALTKPRLSVTWGCSLRWIETAKKG